MGDIGVTLEAPPRDAPAAAAVASSSLLVSASAVAPKPSSPPFYQPNVALPRSEQLQLMQQYLLARMVRGDAELTLYDSASGLGRRVFLAYRVSGPDGGAVSPLRVEPLVADEHVEGALCWTAADGTQGAFALDPDTDEQALTASSATAAVRSVRLRHLRKIVDGPGESSTWSVGDASLRAQTAAACCFSLLTRGGRSVDLEADTPRHKLEWIYGVRGENASSNNGHRMRVEEPRAMAVLSFAHLASLLCSALLSFSSSVDGRHWSRAEVRRHSGSTTQAACRALSDVNQICGLI
jgi:hypothetical protein